MIRQHRRVILQAGFPPETARRPTVVTRCRWIHRETISDSLAARTAPRAQDTVATPLTTRSAGVCKRRWPMVGELTGWPARHYLTYWGTSPATSRPTTTGGTSTYHTLSANNPATRMRAAAKIPALEG